MSETLPGREKMPSRKEKTSLGQRAVALLGERGQSEVFSLFDEPRYGGLETHVAFFQPEEGVFVRVGTLQDWEGEEPRPDAHVVIMEPEFDEGDPEPEEVVVKETTYDFSTGGFGLYDVSVTEEAVVYDQEGTAVRGVQTAGWLALKKLAIKPMPKEERRLLRQALEINFDRQAYSRLSSLIAACGPHNRVELGSNQD